MTATSGCVVVGVHLSVGMRLAHVSALVCSAPVSQRALTAAPRRALLRVPRPSREALACPWDETAPGSVRDSVRSRRSAMPARPEIRPTPVASWTGQGRG